MHLNKVIGQTKLSKKPNQTKLKKTYNTNNMSDLDIKIFKKTKPI